MLSPNTPPNMHFEEITDSQVFHPSSSASSTCIYRSIEPMIASSADTTRPPRLNSPFHFATNATNIHLSHHNHVRKPTRSNRTRTRRQPHCARTDCPVTVSRPHRFDSLPWISVMDIPPSEEPTHDIADLSELPVDLDSPEFRYPGSGMGPVRRRKTSFRSDPLCSEEQPSHPAVSIIDYSNLYASTPAPKHRRSRIAFHDLMPILSCDIHKFSRH